jgi:hypothetical protein
MSKVLNAWKSVRDRMTQRQPSEQVPVDEDVRLAPAEHLVLASVHVAPTRLG